MKIQNILFFVLIISSAISTKAEIDLSKHIVRQESYWQGYKDKKLDEKLVSAPSEVIDYLTKDNIKNGWPNKPTAAKLSEEYRNDLLAALKELPKDTSEKINKKLTAILVINDLGGSGYTESILSSKGNLVAGFVVLDVSVLNKNANQWATWKETSPFKVDGGIQLLAEIEFLENDNRKNALQYILLHEFGHVVSIGLGDVAPWDLDPTEVGSLNNFPFTELSWEIKNGHLVSLFDGKKMDRTGLRYYGPENKRLPSTNAIKLYRDIQNTNFPTLYAATNPHDDFAESFVTYVHSVQMKRPWKIHLRDKSQRLFEYGLCWEEVRCKMKRKGLEDLLNQL